MATKRTTPTLEGLRRRLTPFQSALFQEILDHYLQKGDWPILRVLFSKHGKTKVRDALSMLGGHVGREEMGPQGWTRFQLGLLGVLLSKEGRKLQKLLTALFTHQRTMFQLEPEQYSFSSAEIKAALKLSDEQTTILGQLARLAGISGGWNPTDGTWTASAMQEAADFPQSGDLSEYVSDWVCRFYNPAAHVFQEQRVAQYIAATSPENLTVPVAQLPPAEITMSLARLREKHPDPKGLGFLIMRFTPSDPFGRIVDVIKSTGLDHGLVIIRADDVHFHDDLWGNVRTLLHGCGFGIAVYERIETNEPNANVGLEVGYLMAMNKPVLFLKDKSVRALHSDLAGKLYKTFDPYKPEASIPGQLTNWLKDNGIAISKGKNKLPQ